MRTVRFDKWRRNFEKILSNLLVKRSDDVILPSQPIRIAIQF